MLMVEPCCEDTSMMSIVRPRLPITQRPPSDLTGLLPAILLAPPPICCTLPPHRLFPRFHAHTCLLPATLLALILSRRGPRQLFSPYLTPDLALNLFMLVALCIYKHTDSLLGRPEYQLSDDCLTARNSRVTTNLNVLR